MKKLSILGATGSIGTQTLDVIRKSASNLKLIGVTANTSVKKVIEIIEWLQTNLDKKRSTDAEFVRFLLYRVLFPWQKEVFNDSSRTITMLCGRRSGKSFVDACKMIDHCLGGHSES